MCQLKFIDAFIDKLTYLFIRHIALANLALFSYMLSIMFSIFTVALIAAAV